MLFHQFLAFFASASASVFSKPACMHQIGSGSGLGLGLCCVALSCVHRKWRDGGESGCVFIFFSFSFLPLLSLSLEVFISPRLPISRTSVSFSLCFFKFAIS